MPTPVLCVKLIRLICVRYGG